MPAVIQIKRHFSSNLQHIITQILSDVRTQATQSSTHQLSQIQQITRNLNIAVKQKEALSQQQLTNIAQHFQTFADQMERNPLLSSNSDTRKANIFVLAYLWSGVTPLVQRLVPNEVDFTKLLIANIKHMNLIDIVMFCNLLHKGNGSLTPELLKVVTRTFELRCQNEHSDMAKSLSQMLFSYLKIAQFDADYNFVKFLLLQLFMKREPLHLESCIKIVGALPLIEDASPQMQNIKRNILDYTLSQLNCAEIEAQFAHRPNANQDVLLSKMVTLVHGIMISEDPITVQIVNLVASRLAEMLHLYGHNIKLLTVNRSLLDLSQISYSQEYKDQLEWSGIHELLVNLILQKVPGISSQEDSPSPFDIKMDITNTLATMKAYLYYLQDLQKRENGFYRKPSDILSEQPQLQEIYRQVGFQICNNLAIYSETELIKMFFELSGKRTLQHAFLNEKLIAFFNGLNFEKMIESNYQDFVHMGYILNNKMLRSALESDTMSSYTAVLQKQNTEQFDFKWLDTLIKARAKMSQEQLQAYHIMKLKQKATYLN